MSIKIKVQCPKVGLRTGDNTQVRFTPLPKGIVRIKVNNKITFGRYNWIEHLYSFSV